MKALYFDCSAGISGDMIVAALLDLGDNKKYLVNELRKLKLNNFKIYIHHVKKFNRKTVKFDVITEPEHKHRNINDIFLIINESALSNSVKTLSKKIFAELGTAEAIVHETTIEKIHFHEVGAIDSIIDIISASILLDKLGIDNVYCSRISDGYGKIKIQHGIVDIPVPAVRQLLQNFSFKIIKINKEMTTPTGAAILKTICKGFFAEIPFMAKKTGFGAGTRDLPFPNVLQISIGEMDSIIKDKLLIETNIDDMSPEMFPYIIEKLMQNGALDAFITPCYMKKMRVGFLLSVTCDAQTKDELIRIIFRETTTFGVRLSNLERIELEREIAKVKTKYGEVRIKNGYYDGKLINSKPEFEDCKKLATKYKIPLKTIYSEISKNKIMNI